MKADPQQSPRFVFDDKKSVLLGGGGGYLYLYSGRGSIWSSEPSRGTRK